MVGTIGAQFPLADDWIPHVLPVRFCDTAPRSSLVHHPMRPTLLIADDHQLFAESLRSLLSPTYDVVGIAANGKELTEMAMKLKPNLVMTDLSMPLLNGLDAVQTLTGAGLRSKFIVLTMHTDISLAVLVFRAGASAFVLKTASGDELKRSSRGCTSWRMLLESRSFPAILSQFSPRRPAVPWSTRHLNSPLVSAKCCNSSPRGKP